MALIKCPECGKEISDTTTVCIHCGYNLNKPKLEEYVPEEGESNLTTVSVRDGFDVMIVDYVGNKSTVSSSLSRVLNCTQSEAKSYLDAAPAYLYTDIDEKDATAICRLLQNAGVRAALYDPNGNCTYYQPANYNDTINNNFSNVERSPLLDILPGLLMYSSLRRMASKAISPVPRRVVVQRRNPNIRIRPNMKGPRR